MSQPTFPGGIDLLPGPQGPPIPSNALRIVTIGGAPFSTTDGITFIALGGGAFVPDGVTITGAGTVASPAVATAQFGANTTVQLQNAATTKVNAWQSIITLTNTGVGTEASQAALSLLTGGAQVTARIDTPLSTYAPNGTATLPGYAFLGTAGDGTVGDRYGMFLDQANSALGFATPAAGEMLVLINHTVINLLGDGQFLIGSLNDTGIKRNTSQDCQVIGTHDIVIGADGALATNATAGYLEIPTCAGTPTGTATVRSGKVAIIYDTTNNKIAVSTGGGTWKQTAALS